MKDSQPLKENVHTAPSYSFATYCSEAEIIKRKRYFSEHFDLDRERLNIFGPDNKCDGPCQGTGWVPVSKSNMEDPFRSLWVQAELDTPSDDGWHLVPCPKCFPLPKETSTLDEHIVKQGDKFVLKSKKSNKNLGTYSSRSGAEKREKAVEYFKNIKEDSVLPGGHGTDKNNKPAVSTSSGGEDSNNSAERKDRAKQKRREVDLERKSKHLLPYEFTSAQDAERSGGHLGLTGSHTTGGGVYKPGSSDVTLRNAVYQKKEKQQSKSMHTEETVVKAIKQAVREKSK